jgi:hypothetical protein
MEEPLLWGLCLSFLKFIYLGFLASICSKKEEEKKKQKKILGEKKIIAWWKLAKGETRK